MKILYLVLLATTCFSCKNEVKDQYKDHINQEPVVAADAVKKAKERLLKIIDVQSIKSDIDDVTTGFLPKSSSKFFPDKKKNRYYAAYYLIKKGKDSTSNLIGQMIVYDSINPRIYEKTTDEFIEITLIEKGITLYDKFIVGMPEQELLHFVDGNYHKLGNTIQVDEGQLKAFFQVNDGVVTKIKVGIYRDDVNINEMLDESNWNKKDSF